LKAAINLLKSVGANIVRSYALISLNNLDWETVLKDQNLTTLLTI
jgi:adenine/guanine phosphoribosyltransferase-like PRPP-binding protein